MKKEMRPCAGCGKSIILQVNGVWSHVKSSDALECRMSVVHPIAILPGMEEHVEKQKSAAAIVQAESLTKEMNTPKNVDKAAGEMERKSPLFRGTPASPQRELL